MPLYSGATLATKLAANSIPVPFSGCLLWLGQISPGGYGYIYLGEEGRLGLVHRIAYRLHVGPIPEGLELDHLCRVRCCLEPAHLEPVTRAINVARGLGSFGGLRQTCFAGLHPLTEDNIVFYGGLRRCRACRKASFAAKNARVSAERAARRGVFR